MHMHSSTTKKIQAVLDWPTLPPVQLSDDKVREFRTLLEQALGQTVEQSDDVVRQWAINAIETASLLREVSRRVRLRQDGRPS